MSILAAIDMAIAGVVEEGPHQGGLVRLFESGFVQPPVSRRPFQRMDDQGRAALKGEGHTGKGGDAAAWARVGAGEPAAVPTEY